MKHSNSALQRQHRSHPGGVQVFSSLSIISILLSDLSWLCLGTVTPTASPSSAASSCVLARARHRCSGLPTAPGFAPGLLCSPGVLTEKITEAQHSHNPSLEKQLVSPLSHTHIIMHNTGSLSTSRNKPHMLFYSSTEYYSSFFPFSVNTSLSGKTLSQCLCCKCPHDLG